MTIEDHDLAVFACRPTDIYAIPAEFRDDLKPRLASDTTEQCGLCHNSIQVSEAARQERDKLCIIFGSSKPIMMACWPCLITGIRIPGAAVETLNNYHLRDDGAGFEPTQPEHKFQLINHDGEMKMVARQSPELPTGMYL